MCHCSGPRSGLGDGASGGQQAEQRGPRLSRMTPSPAGLEHDPPPASEDLLVLGLPPVQAGHGPPGRRSETAGPEASSCTLKMPLFEKDFL